jgi:hypothetical protein
MRDVRRELEMCQSIEGKIGEFFISRKEDLIKAMNKGETDLLKSLNFAKGLDLLLDSPSGNALFGYGSLKSDFKPTGPGDTIIEVKYIRMSKLKGGSTQHNECDIKNSLSQVIEQAVCKSAGKAILVVIDAGRANARDWTDQERRFISMFKTNPFDIFLSVVRVKLNPPDVSYEVI